MLTSVPFDSSPFREFISQEMAYQDHRGCDPDLGDHRKGDFIIDLDVEDDLN